LRVTRGTVDDLDTTGLADRYDVVTLNHVIEHLHDPAEALHRIRAILRPGGRLWIATPNLRSLGHRAYRRHWEALDPPRHLVLFDRASLEGLVRRSGLAPLPPPRATPDAALTFPASAAIRDGRPTFAGPARRARATRARAALAGRIAGRRTDLAEELVVLAHRPG
jgi:SAM-dependent methyltransferase